MSYPIDLNDIAERQWTATERRGWHNKSTLEALALIASEVGEAVNEARGDVVSEAFSSELADIILRTLDLAESLNINIQQAVINKLQKNESNSYLPKEVHKLK